MGRHQLQLRKRGPDECGEWHYETKSGWKIDAYHYRLAVIGGEESQQPHETEQGVLVYNGEIYNFKELGQMCGLKTDSDTVVLARMCDRRSDLGLIRGMYAFAYYSKADETLTLARDHFGTKPLYIYENGDTLISSSIKAIRDEVGDLGIGKLTRVGAELFLRSGSVIVGKEFVKGVEEVKPGDLWTLKLKDKVRREKKRIEVKETGKTWVEEVDSSIPEEGMIGLLLSGGVDSCYIANILRKKGVTNRVIALTLCSSDNSNAEDVESAIAIAKVAGIESHCVIRLTEADIDRYFREWISEMEVPTEDGLNAYIAARYFQNRGIKVCLTGTGGDEIFGGYSFFIDKWKAIAKIVYKYQFRRSRHMRIRAEGVTHWRLILCLLRMSVTRLASLQRLELGSMLGSDESFPYKISKMVEKEVNTAVGSSINESLGNHWFALYGYCMPQLLRDMDVFGMACGIEIRPCLLNQSLLLEMMKKNWVPKNFGAKKVELRKKIDNDLRRLIGKKKKGFTIKRTSCAFENNLEYGSALKWLNAHFSIKETESRVTEEGVKRLKKDSLVFRLVVLWYAERMN